MKNEEIKMWALNQLVKKGDVGSVINFHESMLDLVIEKARQEGKLEGIKEEKQRLLEYINNVIKNSYEYIDEHEGNPHNTEIIRKYGLIDGLFELDKKVKTNEK